jgi:ribose 5-phosphate isomerase
VPVAVLPFAAALYPWARPGLDDNGLVVVDLPEGDIDDPAGWDAEVAGRPGVVATGVYPGAWVERVFVAGDGGVRELRG